jgi:hypothetical protein
VRKESASEKGSALLTTRWKLAAALYEVAYAHAANSGRRRRSQPSRVGSTTNMPNNHKHNNNDSNNNNDNDNNSFFSSSSRRSTSVPWLLCGEYLNQIKIHTLEEAMMSL